MKKLLVLCMFLVTFFTVKSQDLMNLKPTGYVNDYENIFTPEQKADLEKICSDYEKLTTIEICLVTSADFNLDYDTELANKWDVGKDGLDNGLLIVLSKAQRDCSVRTGLGLECLLPDGTLKLFTNDIFPRTLSNDQFYEGMRELILACQKHIGTQGYEFAIKYKEIQEEYNSQMTKVYMYRTFEFILLLIILGGIGFLIYRHIKKQKDFKILKVQIIKLMNDIEAIKNRLLEIIPKLPIELQTAYDNRLQKLTDELVTNETRSSLQIIFNQLLDFKSMINTIDSTVDSILKTGKDIEKYLQFNYPYCEKYLKDELNSFIPETQLEVVKSTEYTKERMTALIGIQTSLDSKLKSFLNKTYKIDGIIKDNASIKTKIEELENSYTDYIQKKTILSGSKIGNRFNSLVNLDFDTYIKKIESDINISFKALEKGNYDDAIFSYGNYITTVAVISGAFASVVALLASFNKGEKFIEENQGKLKNLIFDIDNHINKSGVSYTRKSSYENIKTSISKYKIILENDIIGASILFETIIKELDELLYQIKSDISSHEDDIRRKAAAAASAAASRTSSSSSSRSGFGGFGGGSFGGGGVRSKF